MLIRKQYAFYAQTFFKSYKRLAKQARFFLEEQKLSQLVYKNDWVEHLIHVFHFFFSQKKKIGGLFSFFLHLFPIIMRSTKSNLLKLVKQRVTKCESKKVLILTEKSGDDKQPNKLLQNVWDTKWELEGKMMKAQYPRVCSIQKKAYMTFCSPHWRQHIRAKSFAACWHQR